MPDVKQCLDIAKNRQCVFISLFLILIASFHIRILWVLDREERDVL
jgi:hypothetical protein